VPALREIEPGEVFEAHAAVTGRAICRVGQHRNS
jgi:hypothetical protein